MCAPERLPSPPQPQEDEFQSEFHSDDNVSEDSSEASEGPPEDLPRYSPDDLAAIFLDFYRFLTTLHYKPEDLKVPPVEGWGQAIPDCYAEAKSERAMEVLRRLPYLNCTDNAAIHYKSRLLDYTCLRPEFFTEGDEENQEMEDLELAGDDVDPADVIYIAQGYESGGRQFLLNVVWGEITEDEIRCSNRGPYDVRDFLDKMKEDYRSLRLIPLPGHVTEEAEDVPENYRKITEAEVQSQSESWGTDLDWQYVRQIYRSHGWPDSFRRDEAFKAMEELNNLLSEIDRGAWETEAQDPSRWHIV